MSYRLTEAQKNWMEGYIEGLARFIAKSPHESPEEFRKEREMVKRLLEEKRELPEFAERWRKRLLEALSV
ncbi:MAG: hypothetical protein DRN81_03665 [Thermoproteota archaeon]|nr:MAG: hypothetical protein DRN81_03665 [Candidatus Korarchaeota archaeon]